MCLSLIQKRLRGNYYTNKMSVVSDMETLKEDCYKYNEDGHGYYELACRMYDKFKLLVESIEEPQTVNSEESSQFQSEATNSNLETARSQLGLRSGSFIGDTEGTLKSPPTVDAADESSTIIHEGGRAKAKPCAETGSSEKSDTEYTPSRRINLRARRKPGNADKDSEDQSRKTDSRSCRRRATRKESILTKFKEEESFESTSSDESDDEKKDHQKVKPRGASRDLTQLQESGARILSRRTNRRGQKKPSYADKSSQGEESSESSSQAGSGSDDEEDHQEEELRCTRRPTAQLQATRASTRSRRTIERKRRSTSYEKEDSEEEKSSESGAEAEKRGSHGGNSDSEIDSGQARRSTRQMQATETVAEGQRTRRRKGNKPSYREINSSDEEYRKASDEDESESNDEGTSADEAGIDASDDDVSSEEEFSNKKRKRGPSKENSPKRKRGRGTRQSKGSLKYPNLEKWPRIPGRKLSGVAVALLNKLVRCLV